MAFSVSSILLARDLKSRVFCKAAKIVASLNKHATIAKGEIHTAN